MERWILAATALIGLAACQSTSRERVQFADDGFSIHAIDEGWVQSRDKGSVVFRGAEDTALARTTIVVRSVRNDDRASAKEVIAATANVLSALPSAEIRTQHNTKHKHYDATTFDLTFIPKSKATPYDRRHVVLTGDKDHIYHVMLTAPAGELGGADELFDDIVGSLKGEG